MLSEKSTGMFCWMDIHGYYFVFVDFSSSSGPVEPVNVRKSFRLLAAAGHFAASK
ncbi:MAG: hypothetical protein P4N59_30730 [Negativicutes bacterium]|nr:hypothetical protein [Negativicutes bacterium]